MKVIMRPMLDPDWRLPVNNPDAIYRGDIGQYFNATEWDVWFASYESLLAPWIAMAQRLGVEGFCLGAELSSTESQPDAWRRIAALVRSNYTVPDSLVYYSSVFSPSSFPWDVSDVIGIDVYPRLSLANPDPVAATVPQLVQAWESTLRSLSAMSTANGGKRVLLAETGICSIDMPGVYLTPGYFECYSWPANEGVQAKFYESVFQTAWAQPWSAGVLFWKWALQGGPTD